MPERASHGMTLTEATVRWTESEPELEAKTIESYESVLRLHAGGLADMSLARITTADVRDALRAMRKAGCSRSRTSELRSALSNVFQWGIDARLMPDIGGPTPFQCLLHGAEGKSKAVR